MSLDDIVDITITTATAAPTRVGFGVPLVMCYHTHFVERQRTYTSIAGMVADGFSTTEDGTRMVTALLAQNPKPSSVIVGRNATSSVRTLNFIPTAVNSTLYTIYIGGTAASFTSDATALVAEITAGLKTAIDLLGVNVTTTDNGTSLDVAADSTADQISVYAGQRALFTVNDNTADGDIAADIAAVSVENDTWYTCHLDHQSHAVIIAAAAYIETVYKLLLVSSPDSDIYGAGAADIASALQTAGYARTGLVYHTKANHQYPACAWAGRCLPLDAGSITWKFKAVSGVDYESFTTTEQGYITAKDCNNYVRIAGISMFQEGLSSSGEFLDITRGVDFIRARMQEYVFGALANADKIPFTNAGIAVIQAEVNAVLQLAIGNSILAEDPAPVVTVPLASAVSTSDKANRILPDVTFTGTLAGAIHKTEISGTISV